MQQKKNIRLLISLCVLCVLTLAAWFTLSKREDITVNKDIFRVGDLKAVDKVVLERSGKRIELTVDGTRWKVNGEPADRSMIDVLFATLQQAEPKRPVSQTLQDSVNNTLAKDGVHVSLFQGNKVELEFLAGGNSSKTQAYFKDITEDGSYVMVIPGYRVYTSGIFELEEQGWKDKYVFNFYWRNFQKLNASFPIDPENNFEISMGKSYFEVKGLGRVDTTKVNDFLDAVSLLTVDQYLNQEEAADYDSLMTATSGVEIFVTDISGKTYSVTLYPQRDSQQIPGMVHGTQPALFDVRKIAPLLKSKGWFVKKGA